MVSFFQVSSGTIIAVQSDTAIPPANVEKLVWLFSEAKLLTETEVSGFFVGPRKEMITPWSTNAVEITQNMLVDGILRIEEYFSVADEKAEFDPMLQALYTGLNQSIFTIDRKAEDIVSIKDIAAYNEKEGLALSQEEIDYLDGLAKKLGRELTDSEVFGFSQVNSEHCRHKKIK